MRKSFRILIAAAVMGLAVAPAGTADAAARSCFGIPVTGTLDGQAFSGTLEIEHFDVTTNGLAEQVVLHFGEVSVDYTQEVPSDGATAGYDYKAGQASVSFRLPAVQTKSGLVSIDPFEVLQDELPAGAQGRLQALGALTRKTVASTDALAALLNVTFGLIAGAGPCY